MPLIKSPSSVSFHFQRPCNIKDRTQLKKFLIRLFHREKKQLDYLSYVFCTDDYLLNINQTFLHHDYYTDVITFDLSATESGIAGEIYISVDRVKDNALNLGVSFREELHRVIFHGALHLCGYRDKSRSDISTIRAAEDYYLRRYL